MIDRPAFESEDFFNGSIVARISAQAKPFRLEMRPMRRPVTGGPLAILVIGNADLTACCERQLIDRLRFAIQHGEMSHFASRSGVMFAV